MPSDYPLLLLPVDALLVLAAFGMACSIVIPASTMVAKRLIDWNRLR
jgi:hypothetical protein